MGAVTRRAAAVAAAVLVVTAVALGGREVRGGGEPATTGVDAAVQRARHVGGVALGGAEPANRRRGADYAALRAMNATWVRSDVDWQSVEEEPGRWNFGRYDPVIADATEAGLRHLAILHTVPAWANGGAGNYGPARDPALFGGFCHRAARRYLPLGVHDYELGNEVNLPHPGWDAPTGASYLVEMLVPCATGVRRAAAELGVAVNVMLGSLVPTGPKGGRAEPSAFLAEVYAGGGREHFDSVALHPYTRPLPPAASDHLTGVAQRLHAVMAAHGDGAKRIWATEFGYPTGGPDSVGERQQAAHVDPAVDLWYSNLFAGPLFWYSARDTGTDPRDTEQHFGLLRHDGSAKPAYAALAARLRR
jgi:hypothetical protein